MSEFQLTKEQLCKALISRINEGSDAEVRKLVSDVFKLQVNPLHTSSNGVVFVGSTSGEEAVKLTPFFDKRTEEAQFHINKIKQMFKRTEAIT